MEFCSFIKSVEKPWQPGAVAFQESDAKLGELRPRRRMKTQRRAAVFDLRPQGIEAAVVNAPAVDRFGAERKSCNIQFGDRPASFFYGKIDIMQGDQRRGL